MSELELQYQSGMQFFEIRYDDYNPFDKNVNWCRRREYNYVFVCMVGLGEWRERESEREREREREREKERERERERERKREREIQIFFYPRLCKFYRNIICVITQSNL